MNLIYEKTGKGKQKIILLHGWGLNKEIWKNLKIKNNKNFRFYLVDLPGYGLNNTLSPNSLEENVKIIWKHSPKKAIWLGWSIGGLIATAISTKYEKKIDALITVSSTPYFLKEQKWPGIEPRILENFKKELKNNFSKTIKRFLILQTLNNSNKENKIAISKLKYKILKQPIPKNKILQSGLNILKKADLRKNIVNFKKPFLRIYGELDNLIPKKVIPIIDKLVPNSDSVIIKKAGHAPFLSHPKFFIKLLLKFYKKIKKKSSK